MTMPEPLVNAAHKSTEPCLFSTITPAPANTSRPENQPKAAQQRRCFDWQPPQVLVRLQERPAACEAISFAVCEHPFVDRRLRFTHKKNLSCRQGAACSHAADLASARETDRVPPSPAPPERIYPPRRWPLPRCDGVARTPRGISPFEVPAAPFFFSNSKYSFKNARRSDSVPSALPCNPET